MKLCNEEQASALLLSGGVGVLPTDTIYGIVARAADRKAVSRMYALKQREHKPGTVIAASVDQLVALGVPKQYLHRVQDLWPNSLSIEIPLGPELAYLHQDTGRQGFRVVADERVRSLLKKTGPLVTSSANQPGEQPASTIKDAYDYFTDDVDFYVDGGDLSERPPSTIARVTDEGIEIIRQGAVMIPTDKLAPSQATSNATCPFCLASGLLRTPVLFENDTVYVTQPKEYLIIPKAHLEELSGLSDSWWKDFKAALAAISGQLGNYNLSLNYGTDAGQTTRHLHFWIIPRIKGKRSSGKGLALLLSEIDSTA